ncbi:MAG: CPBP family intramembrane metalloprotease [Planctomycetes bacterium]|nr:CPBP family intramembrane metalloprotease [Planctomycetota bacterium]
MNPTQLYLTAAFSLLIIGAMLASFCVWIGVFSNLRFILSWSGWRRDNHTSRIGLIDLIACFFCIVLAQGLVLFALEAATGQPLFKPGKARLRGEADVTVAPVPTPIDETGEGEAATHDATLKIPQDSQSNLDTAASAGVGSAAKVVSESQGEDHKPQGDTVVSSGNAGDAGDVGGENGSEDGRETTNHQAEGGSASSNKGNLTETPSWLTPYLTLALLLGALLSILVLLLRTRTSPVQLGLVKRELYRDVWIGVLVFLWVTPLVMVVAAVVNNLLGVEYQHPVVDAMKENPYMLPSLFFGAVVCAPIWEEYAFRGLLIGWFDSIRQSGGNPLKILLGAGNQPVVQEQTDAYAPWWPAILSGVIFGGAHFGYGVSWVPLMVLGIVLGRLYQVRRSIVPCVIVHGLFNSLSMVGLAVEILVRKG